MSENTVVWDNSYSVGFTAIDDQHKELVKMINELFESSEKGAAAADQAFFKTIKKAVEYARNHFSDEVKYMVQAEYPNVTEHRRLHDDFMTSVLTAMHEFEAGKTAPIELAKFLKNWLLNHIAKADKQYMPFLEKLKV